MQLKVKEPENPNEGNDNEQTGSSGQTNMVSNNDFMVPEQKDFIEGDGIFGNTQTFDSYMNTDNGLNGTGRKVDQYGNPYDTPYGNNTGNAGNQGYDPNNSGSSVSNKPRKLTKKEFYISPRNRKERDSIVISCIVIIAAALFDVVRVNFWLDILKKQIDMVNKMSETLGMQDEYYIDTKAIMTTQIIMSVILIALAVGIFIWKSRVCAISGFVFTIVNIIYTIVKAHNFRWYWTVIAFGYAMVATIRFNQAWKEYEEDGDWKREW